jgi:hypothetical protein
MILTASAGSLHPNRLLWACQNKKPGHRLELSTAACAFAKASAIIRVGGINPAFPCGSCQQEKKTESLSTRVAVNINESGQEVKKKFLRFCNGPYQGSSITSAV